MHVAMKKILLLLCTIMGSPVLAAELEHDKPAATEPQSVKALTRSIQCPICLEDKTEDVGYALLPTFDCKDQDGRPFRHYTCRSCTQMILQNPEARCPECRAAKIRAIAATPVPVASDPGLATLFATESQC